jgi:hypothetical protein
MINGRAKQVYASDQKKQLIYDTLKKHKKLTSSELSEITGLDRFHSINTSKKMIQDGTLSETKIFCDNSKRWLLKFSLTGKEFTAKTLEECAEFVRDSIPYQNPSFKRQV